MVESDKRTSESDLMNFGNKMNDAKAYYGVETPKAPKTLNEQVVNATKKLANAVVNGRVPSAEIGKVSKTLQELLPKLIAEMNSKSNSLQSTQRGGVNIVNGMNTPDTPIPTPDEYYGTYRRPVYNVSKANANGVYEYDKRFQSDVQNYIKSITPKMALIELNALQSLVPFMIADPQCRHLNSPVKYGYADLLRFMGWNYEESYVSMMPTVDGEPNPLYAEIKYVFPDTYGNMMLNSMHNERDNKIILYQLYAKLNKINADYIKNPKKYANKRSKEYAEIIGALERVVLRKYDPTYLSRSIKGQERPMHTHKMESFVKDLMLFNSILKRHSGTDPLRHPKETTTMKIVDSRFKN